MWQITDGVYDSQWPMYLQDGRIVYVGSEDGISNLRMIDPERNISTHHGAALRNLQCRYLGRSRSSGVSNYFDSAWNIYFGISPLDDLMYGDAPKRQLVQLEHDLLDRIDFGLLDYYGPRKKESGASAASISGDRRPFIGGFEPSLPDSNLIQANYSWDERPQVLPSKHLSSRNIVRPSLLIACGEEWHTLLLRHLGSIELGLSDLMGDHGMASV